jgi:hypothetical protein
MNASKTLWQVFRWPTLLGVLTLGGLVSALLGDGLWDGMGWLLLAMPVGVGLRQGLPSRRCG